MGQGFGLYFKCNRRPLKTFKQGQDVKQRVWASLVAKMVKNLPANTGDLRNAALIPGWGRSPGGGYGSPLQYPCWRIPRTEGAWWVMIHGVAELDMTEVI